MARGMQTTLTLRLIDGVSAPAKAARAGLAGLNAGIGALKSGGSVLSAAGRSAKENLNQLTVAGGLASVGIAAAAKSVYDIQKSLNVSVAAGNLTLEQRNEMMRDAVRLNADYAATSKGIVDAGNELLKSGLNYDQTRGALPGILSAAQAMGVPLEEASAAIVNSMTQLRLPMTGVDDTMKNSARLADLYAHAVNETTASLDDLRTSAKYFLPVAASIGMSPEQAFGFQIALAKNGIMGSSAGTGLRSAPISVAAPSKKGREAFNRLGINPADFIGKRSGDASGATIAAALEANGFSAEGVDVAIDGILKDPKLRAAPSKAAAAIVKMIGDDIGIATAEDKSLVADVVQRALVAGVQQVDLRAVLHELKKRGAGLTDFAQIFGKEHASKLLAIDPKALDDAIEGAYRKAPGTADRMRADMMAGIVGDVAEFTASLESLFVSIGNAGLLGDASRGLKSMAVGIDEVARSSPALLRLGAYATIATAALAPAGLAIAGAAAVASLAINPLILAGTAMAGLIALNWRPLANGLRSFDNALRRSIDPSIIAAMKSQGRAARDWMASFRVGRLSFNRLGDDLGQTLGRGVNAAARALPKMRAAAGALVAFGQAAVAALGPRLAPAIASLGELAETFAAPKIEAALRLGEALKTFGQNASAAMGPALAAGIDLVGTSFNTLIAGGEAVIRILNATQTGFVAFASGLLEAISPDALASTSRGFAALADAASRPVALLGDGFRSISNAIEGSTASLATFASDAGASVGAGINAAVSALSNGRAALSSTWGSITGLFAEMGRFVPDFSPLVGAIQSAIGSIVAVLERVGNAVSAARNAISGLAGGGVAQAHAAGAAVGAAPGPLPRRASGGSIRGGRDYLVGERGPEIFRSGANGFMTPNHRLPAQASGPITIHVNGAGDPEAVANRVIQKLDRATQRSGQVGMGRN